MARSNRSVHAVHEQLRETAKLPQPKPPSVVKSWSLKVGTVARWAAAIITVLIVLDLAQAIL